MSVDLRENATAVRDALRQGRSVALVRCAYMAAGLIPCRFTGRAPCSRCRQLARAEMAER